MLLMRGGAAAEPTGGWPGKALIAEVSGGVQPLASNASSPRSNAPAARP
ncbi:hypothetical protein ACFQU2_39960 [Siccirubricoccus deserti]